MERRQERNDIETMSENIRFEPKSATIIAIASKIEVIVNSVSTEEKKIDEKWWNTATI